MDRAGATVPVQSIKACVVYDPSDGRIHHEHRVLTLTGGANQRRTRSRPMPSEPSAIAASPPVAI